jgi:uncharacterized membrane protein YhhN
MKTAVLLKIFIAVGLSYLMLLLLGNEDIAWFMKPTLLPLLIAGVAASQKFPTKNTLLLALLFSWLGDIVLMFANKGELYFIIGLVLFLTAHILYIVLFNKQQKIQNSKDKTWLYIGLVSVIGYLFGMLFVLYPTLGGLKIPVTIYAIVISTMLLMTIKGLTAWKSPANYYIFAGAICFVTSDSLLAFDKFYTPIPMPSFNIMSTYLVAQFLIAFGILVLNKKQHAVLSNNAAI